MGNALVSLALGIVLAVPLVWGGRWLRRRGGGARIAGYVLTLIGGGWLGLSVLATLYWLSTG